MPRVHPYENLLPQENGTGADAAGSSTPLLKSGAATQIIKKVVAPIETEDGWVPLGAVGAQLANLASDFDPRTYGFTNAFDVDQTEGKPLRIRVKRMQK